MNNTVNLLRILKWAAFPLGWIMYMVTKDVVGSFWSVFLGTAATVSFWMLVRKEETVQMEKGIAKVIQTAIMEYNRAYNVVEIKRIRSGVVARVYVMGDEDTMQTLLKGMQRAISEALQREGLQDRIWVFQMTTIDSEEDLPRKRELLNKMMIKDMEAIRKKRAQADKDKDGTE